MKATTKSACSTKNGTALVVTGLLMLVVALLPKTARADSAETVAAVLVGAAILYAATDDYDDRKRDRYDKRHSKDHRSNYGHYDNRGRNVRGYQQSHWDHPGRDYRHDQGRRDWSDRGKRYDKRYSKPKGGKHRDHYVLEHSRGDALFSGRVHVH